MGFGKPKYGGNGQFTKSVKLKSGDQGQPVSIDVRILPPMHSLAETGTWAVYLGTHYGYKGVNARDASKPSYRPFRCIFDQDYRTKLVRQECPECNLIAEHEEKKEAAEAAAKAAGHTDEEIKEIVKPTSSWLQEHNCDRKWHMHVKLATGEFATLQISHKTKKLLEDKIIALQTDEGIDALDLDTGAWFRFTRSGKFLNTQDTVDVVQESVRDPATGRVTKTTKLAPLTQAEQEAALKTCQDLSTLVRSISYEQIRLLTLCSGDPEDVDEIFAMGQKKESTPTKAAPAAEVPVTSEPKSEQKAVLVVKTDVPQQDQAAMIAQLQAQLAALSNAQTTKAAPPAAVAEAVTVTKAAPVAEAAPPEPPKPAATPADGLTLDRQAFMDRFKPKAK